ncbi:MAG: hypothetical protein M3209_17265 [Acidobacteriota bacterium]|nr:hypothetical protein [Acidobacteriota bacterium]
MAISDNIKEVMEKIRQEHGTGSTPTGDEVRRRAYAAIMKGANSNEWKEYMRLFAKNEAELAKLMPEPESNSGSGSGYGSGYNNNDAARRNLARVYLLGNGPCGGDSPTGAPLDFGVGNILD